MEWMVIWGVTQAAGFIFKPILEDWLVIRKDNLNHRDKVR
jgi:hypothetical protein